MSLALPPEKTLRFRSGDVELEGRIYDATGNADAWRRGCVVCHPHPLYGGDMNNSVVVAITAALAAEGISTLRFNFRGVGASGGTHGGGEPEIGDARAAVAALRTATGLGRVAIAGYSFGSVVALRMAAADEAAGESDQESLPTAEPGLWGVDAVAAVAPPIAMFDTSFVSTLGGTLLFVAGDRDQYCPRDRFEELEGALDDPNIDCAMNSTERHLVAGADHFLGGFEERVARTVAKWVRERGTYP